MDLPKEVTTAKLTDDLVVDILSRLEYNSFCRCKCAYKAWSALSSDPEYRKKLPNKVTIGLVYQGHDKSAIPLVSMFQQIGEIDGILADVPHYEHLEFLDCCNGLVLCKYSSSYTTPDICRFVVCNPATRQWRIIPDTHPNSEATGQQVVVFEGLEEMSDGTLPYHWIIDMPSDSLYVGNYTHGCFGKSSGKLHYALPDMYGRSIVVWTLDEYAHGLRTWTVKCHLSMADAFGRDDFVHYDNGGDDDDGNWFWNCDYWIIALDLEKDLVFLSDHKTEKLLSYNISTGELNEIRDGFEHCQYYAYVPCYSKLPAQES